MSRRGIQMITGIILIVALILLDQITKLIIVKTMNYGESITVIKDFFYITSHRNTGAAWGIFQGKLWFFIIVTIISLGIFAYLMKDFDLKENTLYSVSLILLIGGTIGNFIDRIFRHEVVDFLHFILFKKYDFPVFNVADTCLTVGVTLLAISVLFGKSDVSWLTTKN